MDKELLKNKKVILAAISTVAVGTLSILTAFLIYNSRQRSISPIAPDNSSAASNCSLNYSIPTPTPTITTTLTSTPTPTPTKAPTPTTSNVCSLQFDLDTQSVCWLDPKTVAVNYKVVSLPSTGGPYYVQTDWYVASPTFGGNHYAQVGPVTVGQTGTIYAQWPGVSVGETVTVEIHAGLNTMNNGGYSIVDPACTDGIDFYWTPYVCAAPTPTTGVARNPSRVDVSVDTYVNSLYPTSNFGTKTLIYADGSPKVITYMKLDLTKVTSNVTKALLNLYVTDASSGLVYIKNVSGSWTEGGMTYNNKPTLGSQITSYLSTSTNTWKQIDLTSYVNANKGKVVSFGFDTSSGDGVIYNSSEATSNRPYLSIQ